MKPAGWQWSVSRWVLLTGLFLSMPGFLRGAGWFSVTDLEGFLRTHPVVARFDPAQKRFRDTPSEFPDPERLTRELAEVRQALADLEAGRPAAIASQAAVADEERFWAYLRADNGRRQRLQERERDLRERLAGPPTTPDASLVPIVRSLVAEFRRGLPPGLVLNRFPPLPPTSPRFEGGNPYAQFLETAATASLDLYLRSLPAAGGFFPSVREPLLWPKPCSTSGGTP